MFLSTIHTTRLSVFTFVAGVFLLLDLVPHLMEEFGGTPVQLSFLPFDPAWITNVMSNYQLDLLLNRISPYYLFSEAATTILNPNVRAIGVVTMSSYSGAIAGSLSFGQSLLLVWPHLVVMAALAIAGFAVAYVNFMRQEIRA